MARSTGDPADTSAKTRKRTKAADAADAAAAKPRSRRKAATKTATAAAGRSGRSLRRLLVPVLMLGALAGAAVAAARRGLIPSGAVDIVRRLPGQIVASLPRKK